MRGGLVFFQSWNGNQRLRLCSRDSASKAIALQFPWPGRARSQRHVGLPRLLAGCVRTRAGALPFVFSETMAVPAGADVGARWRLWAGKPLSHQKYPSGLWTSAPTTAHMGQVLEARGAEQSGLVPLLPSCDSWEQKPALNILPFSPLRLNVEPGERRTSKCLLCCPCQGWCLMSFSGAGSRRKVCFSAALPQTLGLGLFSLRFSTDFTYCTCQWSALQLLISRFREQQGKTFLSEETPGPARRSSHAEPAIPVHDTCDHLCMASAETQCDILHPPHAKITAWLGETRRNCKGGTSQKDYISRSLMLLVC